MSLFLAAGVLAATFGARAFPVQVTARPEVGLTAEKLAAIASVAEEAIRTGKCPGAVVVIGHEGRVIYRKAFGHRALVPEELPMTVHTIFDLASLTKVVATTTAIMQLVEQGKIVLSAPVADYWPEFKANGKEDISVRELMTHYSGLPPDLDLKPDWSGYETAMKMIVGEKLMDPPGTRFIYSDINFETLGELVRRVSGEPLDVYCSEHIFKPLGMKETRFKPPATLRRRIAPTQYQYGDRGKMLWGEVHDPTSYNMGGVAGHAGLFSTADDLTIFAQMLLNGGSYNGVRILSPLTVEKMTSPQNPPDRMVLRGLGWDLDSPLASNRGELFEVGSFGHTGFTGTGIWIDPVTKTYIIILTNRVHPDGKGDVGPMRTKIATLVAAALGPVSAQQVLATRRSLTGYFELMKSYRMQGLRNGKVQTGVDVLEAEHFAPLGGRRVGLITNLTGVDAAGRRTIDLLEHAPGVKLLAVFSPEHGIEGQADSRVPSSTDAATGLPVYSLYGDAERPTDRMLEGLNALVFDIQDAGVRFYTYITTLGYCLEAAAQKGIEFYVLDRPNPINGEEVEGPVLEPDLRSFVAYYPLPIRHGMTVGELAEMFNNENHLGAKLHVIKMRDWQRTDWYDETGLAWVNPSPNLRNPTEEVLYPGVAMVEGANVSVGRGTDTPFELLGAPWVDSRNLSAYLNARDIQGVRFVPVDFKPLTNSFADRLCHGVQIVLIDRQALDPAELGVELAAALWKLYPDVFQLDKTLPLIGARWVLQAIEAGKDPRRIVYEWQGALEQFRTLRSKYLLYP
ncbi:MAG: exo-beta-N-acetylmuramidase NamZ domain-containing protein [Terriglobia bacterium]